MNKLMVRKADIPTPSQKNVDLLQTKVLVERTLTHLPPIAA